MNEFCDWWARLLGLGVEPKQLTFANTAIRGVIVFIATLVMVRFSSRRSLAEKTAFDAVLIVVIASVLARAINGSAPFFPTLGVGAVLAVLHRLMAAAAYHSHTFGCLIKGRPVIIVKDGKVEHDR